MKFGYFDDAAREYVITKPDTPLPWINYLGTEAYFGLISNTAGGYSFFQDAKLRRISRYRYNNVPLDMGGRYIYLRDNQNGEYWSPTWQPTRKPLEDYACRHGLGYTVITSQYHRIETKIKYFVPLGNTLEIWDLTLKNHRDEPLSLSVFSSIEFALWDAQDDSTNFQRNLNIGEVEIVDDVIYHKTEYRERRNHFAYFACSEPLVGFDTQRDEFLGPYRGWESPRVVESGKSCNSIAHGWAPMGSHHMQVRLEPHQSRRVTFVLGYHENPINSKFSPSDSQVINKRSVIPVINHHLQPDRVDKAFDDLKDHWDHLLSTYQVRTEDPHTDRMVNIWNQYQCMVTFNLSRSASYFESGVSRGMGFRDSNQDILGFVHMVPGRARERILDLAATQLDNGGAYHQYQPLSKRGNDDIGGGFNDDPLWLVLSTAAYIKETGDWDILDEPVMYDNAPGSDMPLLHHLERSIEYISDRLGPHRLPLIGRADWNDCLNLNTFSEVPGESFQTTEARDGKVAESVFIAGLFVLALKEMAQITAHCGVEEGADKYTNLAARMGQTILDAGWDGDWFLRAYDDSGDPVGSHLCEEGRIFIESQGICIMAGVGVQEGMAQKALAEVKSKLATEVLSEPRRNLLLSAGLQRERQRVLSHQSMDNDR
jgi:cellobiose phosphorylase